MMTMPAVRFRLSMATTSWVAAWSSMKRGLRARAEAVAVVVEGLAGEDAAAMAADVAAVEARAAAVAAEAATKNASRSAAAWRSDLALT